jgi:hypothetical protein
MGTLYEHMFGYGGRASIAMLPPVKDDLGGHRPHKAGATAASMWATVSRSRDEVLGRHRLPLGSDLPEGDRLELIVERWPVVGSLS